MIYSCLFEICGLMRRRPGERIPEGEMKRKPFTFVGTQHRLSLHHKHYRHTTIGTLKYAFLYKRGLRYTAQEGSVVETIVVAVTLRRAATRKFTTTSCFSS